jgi:hypothetical protein
MSKRLDQEEPADKPASIPPMKEIEADRKRAVGSQVRAAVETVMTKSGSISATQLRKWGPDGTEYFFGILRSRIAQEISKISPPAAPATPPKPNDGGAQIKQTTQRSDARKAAPATLPLSTDRNWTDQQRNRWSTRSRAVMQGLIVAAMLGAGAAIFMRLWGGLAPFILQQIQHWS